MKNKTIIYLLVLAVVLMFKCTVDSNSKSLEKGFYQLKQINKELTSKESPITFSNATLHVIGSDSLEFTGDNNIAQALWGHDHFEYKIEGDKMLLKDEDYTNSLKFSFTTDRLLALEVNTGGFKSLCFDLLVLKLNGKYKIAGFKRRERATNEQAGHYINTVFNGDCLNFIGNDSVLMSKPFAAFIANDSIVTDSIFKFQINEDKILFANQDNHLEIPYLYDGVLRLYVDNNVIERLDLMDKQ